MRHTVYSALNQRMTWLGVDRNIFLVAAGAGMLVLVFTTSRTGFIAAFATFLLLAVAGAIGGRQDPRFLALIPIVAGLKRRYDAGKR